MRKFYLLFTLLAGVLFQSARAQDSVRFNFTIGINYDVAFTNTSILAGSEPRKAFWTFGDGVRIMTPPLAGVTHHYTAAGSYTVCLRIFKYISNTNDSILTGEACRTVNLTNTSTDFCTAGFTDTLYSTATGSKIFVAKPWHNHDKKPEKICWTFGDGTDTCINYNPLLSNNYAVSHHYNQPGQYNVCVKIIYQGGCQTTYCRIVQVGMGDTCKADYNMEPVSASPLSRRFNALPWHVQQKKPLKVCWLFGDGTDTCIQYPVTYTGSYWVNHSYASYGQYNVCVKLFYDGGCEAQRCKVISVAQMTTNDSCQLNIFEMASNTYNLGRHFYAVINPNKVAEKICWNFGDGTDTCIILPNPATTQSLTVGHQFPGPGVYHVCAKLWYAGGCTVVKCREVVVRSGTNICGGYMTDSLTAVRTVQFKGFGITNPNDHVVSWRWTFGDGSSSMGQQVVHTYAAGGNYEVCLYIKTDLGCETRICKHVIIQSTNQAQLQLSPNPVVTTLHAVFQSALQEQVTISIYNANGVLVRSYTRAAIAGTNTWDFDLGTLPSGIYTMIVHSPGQLASAIFFKQ